jgi:hypothetical protein
MSVRAELVEIAGDDFARRFSMRAANLMWFLGAGSSAAAGIPTAADMIWEFKQALYISQRRASPKSVADLSHPAIRAQLQAHIDSAGNLPSAGAPDEYAALFEAAYPAEADRRTYLHSKMAGAKPSYGHLALASLMRAQHARLIWTTNFDPLIADSCAKIYDGTGYLTTATLDAPELAKQALDEGRWPVEIKLHGDFRSRRLKNTPDELRLQDERLRQMLVESCGRFGLAVAGYSGRDSSVMDALDSAVRQGSFPAGLFWMHRGDDAPFQRVQALIERATAFGIEAALVRIDSFDEILRDLIRLRSDVNTVVLDQFAGQRRRWTAAPEPAGNRGWPVLRINALPIAKAPTVCRLVVCEIGGYEAIRQAVEAAKADVLVARTRAGVLGFGSDSDMHAAFDPYGITLFDLHTIEAKRLRNDSGERGLLREAITRAITRHRCLRQVHRGRSDLLVPCDPDDQMWRNLAGQVRGIKGSITGHPGLTWHEGVGIRLDWASERLWLVIEPRIVFEGVTEENKAAASDFGRERTVKRYNRQLNGLVAFWAELLAGGGKEMRAFGCGDGVDAVFRLNGDTAYSRRAGA